MDPQTLFPVITPLILVRRGPENEVGATIAHLTLGVGGGGWGAGGASRTKRRRAPSFGSDIWRPHDAIIKELETKKCEFELSYI